MHKYSTPCYLGNQKGFSPVVLLFAVGVILAIIIATSLVLDSKSELSRNTARVSQINQYLKSFELYYTEFGVYPNFSNVANAMVCLGDYEDDLCWKDGKSVAERSDFTDALVPDFLQRLPKADQRLFGQGSRQTFEGMTYEYDNYGAGYTVRYFMEGNGVKCNVFHAVSAEIGDDTLCTYRFTNN